MQVIEGGSADVVWSRAFDLAMSAAASRRKGTRTGGTQEVLHVCLHVEDPRQRWVVARRPAINPAFAIVDSVWVMAGRRDAHFLTWWNSKLPHYAGAAEEYHGAYGYRLRQHFGLDQLKRACDALCRDACSRQIVLQIWDCNADLPLPSGQPMDADIPCNVCALLKLRDNRLDWTQIVRSNDVVLGLPYNFIQFTTIQEVLAGWLRVELGGYFQLSDSLHIYDRDMGKYDKGTITAELNADRLEMSFVQSERCIRAMAVAIERLAAPDLTRQGVKDILAGGDFPGSYRNLMSVVVAEASRRRRWAEEVEIAETSCSNPLLLQAWRNWKCRWER